LSFYSIMAPISSSTTMRLQSLFRSPTLYAAMLAAMLPSLAGVGWAAATSKEYVVSQMGRAFKPTELHIRRGETVQVLNDDGDLLHHVYLESADFKFDSGDQGPGSRTNITFPKVGSFTVLCAIHPKMKLVVHVQ
jgi:plastocyanin